MGKSHNMKVQAIIPTAGMGIRFKSKQPKSLVMLKDKPVFIHTLEVFEKSSSVDSIIVVAPQEYIQDFTEACQKYHLRKIRVIIEGGQTRHDSVNKGLHQLDAETDIVVIHDGARPLITGEIIEKSIQLCKNHDAVIVAVPIKPTVKRIDTQSMVVEKTLNRDKIWEIQTPQVFKRNIIMAAHQKIQDSSATDDAFLVEQMGITIRVLEGRYRNIKITTPEDLAVAETLL